MAVFLPTRTHSPVPLPPPPPSAAPPAISLTQKPAKQHMIIRASSFEAWKEAHKNNIHLKEQTTMDNSKNTIPMDKTSIDKTSIDKTSIDKTSIDKTSIDSDIPKIVSIQTPNEKQSAKIDKKHMEIRATPRIQLPNYYSVVANIRHMSAAKTSDTGNVEKVDINKQRGAQHHENKNEHHTQRRTPTETRLRTSNIATIIQSARMESATNGMNGRVTHRPSAAATQLTPLRNNSMLSDFSPARAIHENYNGKSYETKRPEQQYESPRVHVSVAQHESPHNESVNKDPEYAQPSQQSHTESDRTSAVDPMRLKTAEINKINTNVTDITANQNNDEILTSKAISQPTDSMSSSLPLKSNTTKRAEQQYESPRVHVSVAQHESPHDESVNKDPEYAQPSQQSHTESDRTSAVDPMRLKTAEINKINTNVTDITANQNNDEILTSKAISQPTDSMSSSLPLKSNTTKRAEQQYESPRVHVSVAQHESPHDESVNKDPEYAQPSQQPHTESDRTSAVDPMRLKTAEINKINTNVTDITANQNNDEILTSKAISQPTDSMSSSLPLPLVDRPPFVLVSPRPAHDPSTAAATTRESIAATRSKLALQDIHTMRETLTRRRKIVLQKIDMYKRKGPLDLSGRDRLISFVSELKRIDAELTELPATIHDQHGRLKFADISVGDSPGTSKLAQSTTARSSP